MLFANINTALICLVSLASVDAFTPKLKSAQLIGNTTDGVTSRDSCGSTRYGARLLWVCRDSEDYDSNGLPNGYTLRPSSASWANLNNDNSPQLHQYGTVHDTFYPIPKGVVKRSSSAPPALAKRSARWVLWPDSPVMIASYSASGVTGYTWVKNTHLNGLTPVAGDEYPSTSLYKVYVSNEEVKSTNSKLPEVQLVSASLWGLNSIPYGSLGNIIAGDYAYLYGLTKSKKVALARVPRSSIEDKSTYEYAVNGAWTKTVPAMDDEGAVLKNAGLGTQGTYYYSKKWKKVVWLGQVTNSFGSPNFYVTTADNPWGPWETPTHLYTAPSGDAGLSYSLQVHPGTESEDGTSIYVSYTRIDNHFDKTGKKFTDYSTQVVKFEWAN